MLAAEFGQLGLWMKMIRNNLKSGLAAIQLFPCLLFNNTVTDCASVVEAKTTTSQDQENESIIRNQMTNLSHPQSETLKIQLSGS